MLHALRDEHMLGGEGKKDVRVRKVETKQSESKEMSELERVAYGVRCAVLYYMFQQLQ